MSSTTKAARAATAQTKAVTPPDIKGILNDAADDFGMVAETLQWGTAILRAAVKTDDENDRRLLIDAANYFHEWAFGHFPKKVTLERGAE